MPDPTDNPDADAELPGRTTNPDGSVTYALAYPVGELTTITQRRMLARDLEASDKLKGSTEQDVFLVARLSGCTVEQIGDELDAYDFLQLSDISQKLIDNPPPGVDAAFDQAKATDNLGAVTCPLAAPVKSETIEISEIRLRRVKPSDIEAAEAFAGGRTARAIFLISRLGDVPQATIRSLDAFDYMRLNKVSKDFLEKRPKTGAKRSSS
jgi:hypothetical protein